MKYPLIMPVIAVCHTYKCWINCFNWKWYND